MKVAVDEHKCAGSSLCVGVAPELFAMTPDRGRAVVKVAVVPDELHEDAREAAECCPFAAIEVEE